MKKEALAGFSLVELVITMLVLALLASFGIFFYSNSYRQNILKTTSEEIIFLVRLAQQESISQKEGNAWGVRFDNTDNNSGFVAVFSNVYAPANIREYYRLPIQVKFQTPGAGSYQEVVFNKLTGLPLATATIEFALAGSAQTKTIVINAAGGVSEE